MAVCRADIFYSTILIPCQSTIDIVGRSYIANQHIKPITFTNPFRNYQRERLYVLMYMYRHLQRQAVIKRNHHRIISGSGRRNGHSVYSHTLCSQCIVNLYVSRRGSQYEIREHEGVGLINVQARCIAHEGQLTVLVPWFFRSDIRWGSCSAKPTSLLPYHTRNRLQANRFLSQADPD